MDRERTQLLSFAGALCPDAERMLRPIARFAELALQEKRTSETLAAFLKGRGFRVERGIAGMDTAFRAEVSFGRGKPAGAVLCERDGPAGLGDGRAMMAHASSRRQVAKGCLALCKVRFTYLGKASHAAAYPEHGVNALDGVLLLFQGIATLRQHLPDTVRVHGIITEGGKAPNIAPERAQAYFYVRGETDDEMLDSVRRVMECARGAATATGCRLRMEEGPYTLSAMKVNPVRAGSYRRALALLGCTESGAPTDRNRGSSDIGNVSQVVPSLQPNVPISKGERVEIHTRSFEKATTSPAGGEGMMEGSRALALAGYDLFSDPRLVREAWKAFRKDGGRSFRSKEKL